MWQWISGEYKKYAEYAKNGKILHIFLKNNRFNYNYHGIVYFHLRPALL